MNRYQELKERQEKEFNAFPKAFAFNEEQLKEGLEKLGLTEHDKVHNIGGGGFIRRDDALKFFYLLERFDEEMQSAIEEDETGEGFIKDMFSYELANHEYGYTYELEPTLDALDLTMQDIEASPALKRGLELALKEFESCITAKS